MTTMSDRKVIDTIIYSEWLELMAPVRNTNESRGVLL